MRCPAMINMLPSIRAQDTIQKTLITSLKGFTGPSAEEFQTKKKPHSQSKRGF